ncbi:MAG: hypothetical protein JNM80_10445 [Phycisphaerae bacterium]|nr:hypothetical protein [Phycisphaerae bacterium]
MEATKRRHRSVCCVVLSTAALASIAWAGVAAAARTKAPRAVASVPAVMTMEDAPTREDRVQIAARIGLIPEHLAAAGVTASGATACMTALDLHLQQNLPALKQAMTRRSEMAAATQALGRAVASGRHDEVQAFQTALAAERLAVSQEQAALQAAFAAATEGLSLSSRTALATIATNRDGGLPVQYAVVSRSERDLVALRDALSAQRIAERLGSSPSAAHAAVVTEANANSAVAAASAGLNDLTAVHLAWNAIVFP